MSHNVRLRLVFRSNLLKYIPLKKAVKLTVFDCIYIRAGAHINCQIKSMSLIREIFASFASLPLPFFASVIFVPCLSLFSSFYRFYRYFLKIYFFFILAASPYRMYITEKANKS